MFRLSTLLILPLLSLPALAQKTWKIQASQLPATINKASSGDILLVSGAANFNSLSIKKPLFIHGGGKASLSLFLGMTIENIPSKKTLVLEGFKVGGFINSVLSIKNCKGSVLLTGASFSQQKVTGCSDVSLDGCSGMTLTIQSSTVSVCNARFTGLSAHALRYGPADPALVASNSTVLVADCILTGGSFQAGTSTPKIGAPAIYFAGSATQTLQVAGITVCYAGLSPKLPVDAVDRVGTVFYDRGVRFVPTRNGSKLAKGLTSIQRHVPVTSISRVDIGNLATVSVRGLPSVPFVLFLGRPGPSMVECPVGPTPSRSPTADLGSIHRPSGPGCLGSELSGELRLRWWDSSQQAPFGVLAEQVREKGPSMRGSW